MTDVNRTDAHPGAEQLAEMIEGRLQGEERARVVAHLADCDECRRVFANAARHVAVVVPFWKRPKVRAIGGGMLALAASLIVVVQLRPEINPFRRPTQYERLVAAVGAKRLIEPRLSGGFEYGPLESTRRGSSAELTDLQFKSEAGLIRERAESTNDPDDLHAWGVAQVLMGRHREGEATLHSALQLRPRDASLAADLAVAHSMRVLADDDVGELARALQMLDHAIALDPSLAEAWFNRALLLERAGHTREAIDAWNKYLSIDSHSAWAEQARQERDELQKLPAR